MNLKTALLALIVAVCCVGCNESEAPKDYQAPDVDVATAEDKADAQKRGWIKLEPLAMVDAAPEK